MKASRTFSFLMVVGLMLPGCKHGKEKIVIKSEVANFTIEIVADSVLVPFGMAFLPDGSMLVTDRSRGEILIVDTQTGKKKKLRGVPQALCKSDGGMLDILPHPDFKNSGWIYYSFSFLEDSLSTMAVERAQLKGDSLVKTQRLFTALPYYKDPSHFGSRMVIKDNFLFITMGERYDLRDSAQSLRNHLGKVMRLYDDGTVPDDNPFAKTKGAMPEIWSYGHRNSQGLTLHPVTGELWAHEHGPKGGDEINIIQPAVNYGWPVVCYGVDYDGKPIGAGITSKAGMQEPLHYYVPSIAPSGMEFYTGEAFPKWKNSLFVGAMARKHLNRLVFENNKVVLEERLLLDKNWRIRNVKQGPDGLLYLGIDGGRIIRLRNAD